VICENKPKSINYTRWDIKIMDIKEEIFNFISTHEAQVSVDMKKKDDQIEVSFTTFGNRAGCRALYDVISMLDDQTRSKVLTMMKNKRVVEQQVDEQKILIERYYKVIDDYYINDKIGHDQMRLVIHRIFERLSVIGCDDPELKELVDNYVSNKRVIS